MRKFRPRLTDSQRGEIEAFVGFIATAALLFAALYIVIFAGQVL